MPDVARKVHLDERSPFIEFGSLYPAIASENATKEELDMLKAAPLFMTDPLTHTMSMEDPRHGCQMAIAGFLDRMCLALRASGLWLRYAALQNLIPSFPWIAPGWRAWGL